MIDKKTLELINSIDLLKELSIYINKDGEIKTTLEQDFSSIDAVELLKIGVFNWFIGVVTIEFFSGKKVCSLPPEVENISWFFCKNENEKIEGLEKGDVSNVKNMTDIFGKCKNFNQDLSHGNVEKVTYGSGYDFDATNGKDEFKPKFKEKGENINEN